MNNGDIKKLLQIMDHKRKFTVKNKKLKIKDEKIKIFDEISSLENLFSAWGEFKKRKEKKCDVLKFAISLEDNIFALHKTLRAGKYYHSQYTSFYICDPKLRHIHKAETKDRIIHHAIMRIIEPYFDKTFIFDSYSSRKNKGTHRAIKRLQKFAWKLSRNSTKPVWVLKCDIKKFFDSVDHNILFVLINKKISDERAMMLIKDIIYSFQRERAKGIPLGNLTSQLFSNIYLNELDQFVKQDLCVKYYIRYVDDFMILGRDKAHLQNTLVHIDRFLSKELKLQLHEQKVSIRLWHEGVDFLGYVIFPHYSVLRTKTKKRILKKIKIRQAEMSEGTTRKDKFKQTQQSYLGMLKYCRARKIKSDIENI